VGVDSSDRNTRPASGPKIPGTAARADAEVPVGDPAASHRLLLGLIPDAVARFALTPPVPVDLPDHDMGSAILERGRVAECNAAFAHHFGCERADEMFGVGLTEVMPGSIRALRWPGSEPTAAIGPGRFGESSSAPAESWSGVASPARG
jgi:PAS domain-containing protein